MNGSTRLSDQEKREMREDAHDVERAKVFRAARVSSQTGSLDAYINFLSESAFYKLGVKKSLGNIERKP